MTVRCAIRDISPQELVTKGGSNIKHAPNLNTVFVDLDDQAAADLERQGFKISKISGIKPHDAPANIELPNKPLYTPDEIINIAGINILRSTTNSNGYGVNIAIIDSGILEEHDLLEQKVIYRENFTKSLMEDKFNHGTAVASIVHAVAPGAGILNMKVLDDKGEGTEEEVVMAIDKCIELQYTYPDVAPSIINLSVGSADDLNFDNIIRHACRQAIAANICIVAAAGNLGPKNGTMMSPAVEQYVIAVGSASVEPFEVSDFSSRGPAPDGAVKPDVIMFGENIIAASSNDEIDTVVKSGTSFAAPFVSGMLALYEGGEKVNQGALAQLLQQYSVQVEGMNAAPIILDGLLPEVCVVPGVSAQQKSNDYGYGLPLGSLQKAQQVQPTTSLNQLVMLPIVAALTSVMVGISSGPGTASALAKMGVIGSTYIG